MELLTHLNEWKNETNESAAQKLNGVFRSQVLNWVVFRSQGTTEPDHILFGRLSNLRQHAGRVRGDPGQQGTTYVLINPFNPEFTIVSFIHYKPRIAVVILVV